MSLSHYNPHDRYKKRAAARMGNFFTVSFLVLLIFGAGFWFGKQYAGQQDKILKERVKSLAAQSEEMERSLVDMRCLLYTSPSPRDA